VEQRYTGTFGAHTVSAQIDLYCSRTHTLSDYKVTSVYAVKDGVKEEYAIQLNIGAELLRKAGMQVAKLQIVAILRDWSVGEYEREKARCEAEGFKTRYPATQVAVLDVPIIPSEEVCNYIHQRCESHSMALSGEQSECSSIERWEKPSKFAVVKTGQKRAYRLHENEASALVQADGLGKGYEVQLRRGESTRCERYCKVKEFCQQYKLIKETK
jgi:hypothetical protein